MVHSRLEFSFKRQRGVVLLVALLILLVMAILGLTAVRGGVLQLFMTVNSQQSLLTEQAADSAVGAFVASVNTTNDLNGSTILAALNGSPYDPSPDNLNNTELFNAAFCTDNLGAINITANTANCTQKLDSNEGEANAVLATVTVANFGCEQAIDSNEMNMCKGNFGAACNNTLPTERFRVSGTGTVDSLSTTVSSYVFVRRTSSGC